MNAKARKTVGAGALLSDLRTNPSDLNMNEDGRIRYSRCDKLYPCLFYQWRFGRQVQPPPKADTTEFTQTSV